MDITEDHPNFEHAEKDKQSIIEITRLFIRILDEINKNPCQLVWNITQELAKEFC